MKADHLFPARATMALGMALLTGIWTAAQANPVHESTDAAIAHREGRAGVLAGSTMVEAPLSWRIGGDAVGVTFDPGFAQRTNMPRETGHEGPVSDRMQAGS